MKIETDDVMVNQEGLNRRGLDIQDYIIYVIICFLPYLEGGPWNLMYNVPFLGNAGPGFVCFILSTYIGWISFRRNYKMRFTLLSISVWVAALYSIIRLCQTINNTGLTEALTIYRKGYIYLLSFAMIMNYLTNMENERIVLLGRLIVKSCILFSIIYFAQCLGFQIFVDEIGVHSAGGIKVTRNIIGFPPIIPVLMGLVWMYMIFTYDKRFIYVTFIFAIACIISYTRGIMFSTMILMLLLVVLHTLKYGFGHNIKLIFYVLIGVTCIYIVSPDSLLFWESHIHSTFDVELKKDIGTYAFRERLIEKALLEITKKNEILTGVGYIRDAAKGQYSLVLGTDTFIAPILWCEGFIGIVLRVLPIFILLITAIRIYAYNVETLVVLLSSVIIASILSQIPIYVQTTIIMNYSYIFAQLLLILTFIYNYIHNSQDNA